MGLFFFDIGPILLVNQFDQKLSLRLSSDGGYTNFLKPSLIIFY